MKILCLGNEFIEEDSLGKKIGIELKKEGFETKTYRPPLIGLDDITTAEDLITRNIGENIYASKSPQERADEMLLRDMARETIKEVRANVASQGLIKTGAYQKGWGYSTQGSSIFIRNRNRYQLTHLLEKGHALS